MTTELIKDRIAELEAERALLETTHNAQYQQNQKMNQEFQQQAVKNQTRYAQLSGAILELKKLITPTQGDNHDNLPTTLNLDHRASDVCARR
jgi:hypothetical protein